MDYAVCGAKQEATRYKSFCALKSVKGRCYYRIDFVCIRAAHQMTYLKQAELNGSTNNQPNQIFNDARLVIIKQNLEKTNTVYHIKWVGF